MVLWRLYELNQTGTIVSVSGDGRATITAKTIGIMLSEKTGCVSDCYKFLAYFVQVQAYHNWDLSDQ